MKSVLLHVSDDPLFGGRLKAALDLTREIDGHLLCLQTRQIPPYLGSDLTGFVGSASMVVQLIDEENKAIRASRNKLEAQLAQEGVSFSFLDTVGAVSDVVISHALLVDVIVMSLAGEKNRSLATALSSTLMVADAPILAIPEESTGFSAKGPAVLAWKPTAEAAHAIKRAVPLLQLARSVTLVSIEQESDSYGHANVAAYLAHHGVKVDIHKIAGRKEDAARLILENARALGAGFVVMGGYSRSRAMEFLMGGVTRKLLQQSPLPLFLAH